METAHYRLPSPWPEDRKMRRALRPEPRMRAPVDARPVRGKPRHASMRERVAWGARSARVPAESLVVMAAGSVRVPAESLVAMAGVAARRLADPERAGCQLGPARKLAGSERACCELGPARADWFRPGARS